MVDRPIPWTRQQFLVCRIGVAENRALRRVAVLVLPLPPEQGDDDDVDSDEDDGDDEEEVKKLSFLSLLSSSNILKTIYRCYLLQATL